MHVSKNMGYHEKGNHILMEGSPYDILPDEIKESAQQKRGITALFELHIWSVT
jgi:Co/Zn/Cd efflux system component